MGVADEKKSLTKSSADSKEYGAIPHSHRKERSQKTCKKEETKVSVWKLFQFSKKLDVLFMFLGTFFAFINGVGWPLLAVVFGDMTNTFLLQSVQPSNSSVLYGNYSAVTDAPIQVDVFESIPPDIFQSYMTTYSILYAFIGVAVLFASTFQIMAWVVACERQTYIIRQEFFYQVLRHEISWFDKNQTGELTTKLNDDLERVREGIGDKFSMVIQYGSTFVIGFVVGFLKGWQLTLVIMSLTPLLALSSAFLGKLVASSSAREQQKYSLAGGIAEEVLSSIKTVTSFNGQEREVKRYSSALLQGMKIAIRKYVYIGFAFGFTFLVLYGAYALAFWYGSKMVIAEKMTAGDVFAVFFAVMIGSFSLGNAMPHLAAIATAQGSAQKIYEIIESVPQIDPYSLDGIQPSRFSSDIEFHNVTFSYPSRNSIQVLKKFSLYVPEGKTVALCGSSGSGKSTVVNLILRFYDPTKGYITAGGFDLKSLNVHWLRSKIGLVSQEPVLFSGSIAKNIEYGYQGITFQNIVAAAKMANAHDFISKLPKGYDTLVGEKGAQLSGGQKQRIAIARALVRDPRILLLDEATSALDSESEAIVQQALDKAQKGRTTIVIAHRLSTIKGADIICAMENGEIKEKGTHDELLKKHGLYYKLVTNQVFTDASEACFESSGRSESDYNESLKLRKKSRAKSIHESHRLISRLESEIKEESISVPSGLQILKVCKDEWKEIVLGSIFSVVTGAVMPVYAIFYSEIFNTFTLSGDDLKYSAIFWSMMFLVLAGVTCVGHICRTLGYSIAGEKLTMKLRNKAFTNILRQDISWFEDERHSTGKIATRLATDVPMVKSAAGTRIGTVISAAVTLGASIIIAFIFGWKLALALLAVVPILMISGIWQMKILKGHQKRDAELMSEAGNVASEAIENIRTVQSLTLERAFYEKYIDNLLLPFIESKKNAIVYAIAFAFSQAIMFFTYSAAFRLGAYLVAYDGMKPVNVYRVFFAMAFSAVSAGQWTSYLPDYTKAKLSAGLIFNLINTDPQIDSSSEGGIKPEVSGKVELNNVYFRYPARRNVCVLQGINLTVEPGKTLALVGPSGCGKSTVISLIQRFYDPEQGTLKIDGFDIKTLNVKYLRHFIAVVSQEPVLFNCSIRENIVYGIEEEVKQTDIEKAAQLANIHDFIKNLPQGYDTPVGERGKQLSGGQKQRIAIARALVRKPKILLLDEATSALDTESEKLVQDALDHARLGRTCIIIAHRLSTIQGADCIAVLDNGKIVEIGTHEELMNKNGTYFKLVKRQCS